MEALRIAASLANLNHSGVAMLAASPQLNPTKHIQIILEHATVETENTIIVTQETERKRIFKAVVPFVDCEV